MAVKEKATKESKESLVTINRRSLKLTNLSRVYFPDEGISKGDVIAYYNAMAGHILPYLKKQAFIAEAKPQRHYR